MKKYFTKRNLIIITGVAVLILVLFFAFRNGNGKQTVSVMRADIIQEVAATGKVKPNQSVNLGFDKSGRVENVNTLIGEMVKKGQIIASLESGEVLADLTKARASLQEEKIKLREIKSTTPVSYNDASKNLDAAIKEGFVDADNAVRNKADQFFKNIPNNPQFEISITSGNFIHYFNVPSDVTLDINSRRKDVENILNSWKETTNADQAISNLNKISLFLDKMANAVNSFTSSDYAYDTTVNNYKSAISGARSDVSGAISAIVTAKDKLNSAPTLGEGGQFENILTQEAKVAQAEANVSSLEASLDKYVIRAPFDGVVSLQDAKVGSAVSAGNILVSIISPNDSYIEANISEIHIGKVSLGNPVSVTFDAFPNEKFEGFVSYIEPGDVIVDGVVNYKIRVELGEVMVGENGQQIMKFSGINQKIKSGLTANLKIQTAKREFVLTIPLYAVLKEENQNFVNKLVDKKYQKIPVSLGLSGSNGLAEILSGLNEGDVIEF